MHLISNQQAPATVGASMISNAIYGPDDELLDHDDDSGSSIGMHQGYVGQVVTITASRAQLAEAKVDHISVNNYATIFGIPAASLILAMIAYLGLRMLSSLSEAFKVRLMQAQA